MTETPLKPPPSPSKELLSSTSFLLKRLGWVVKGIGWQAYETTGLTPQHYAVLSLLDEGAREAQGTIADALGYDRSHLVGLLDEAGRLRIVAGAHVDRAKRAIVEALQDVTITNCSQTAAVVEVLSA